MPTTGTVLWFNDAKGYGFAIPSDGPYAGKQIFVLSTSIIAEGFRTLSAGDVVTFDVVAGPNSMLIGKNVIVIAHAEPQAAAKHVAGDDLFPEHSGDSKQHDVSGTSSDDTLAGGAQDDRLWGKGGNDHLDGGAGDDRIAGGRGNDVIAGGSGKNILSGDAGNDTFVAGGGNDTIRGGAGFDTVDFSASTGSVTVNLHEHRATGFGTDTLQGIEAVIGSQFDDRIVADDQYNVLTGGDGHDTFVWGRGDAGRGADAITDFALGDHVDLHAVTKGNVERLQIKDDGSDTHVYALMSKGWVEVVTLIHFTGHTQDDLLKAGAILI